MQCIKANTDQKGFTLVEMLIIAPFVLLVIGVLVVFLVVQTSDTLRQAQRNTMAYEVQNALNSIESDTTYATSFNTVLAASELTSISGVVPQGPGAEFDPNFFASAELTHSADEAIIIKAPATTASPLSATRTLVYLDKPDATCSSDTINNNDVAQVLYVYFVKNNILWRRTIMVKTSASACSGYSIWQKSSCPEAYVTSTYSSVCKVSDEKLTENISKVSVQYYQHANSTTALTTSGGYYTWKATSPPQSISVSITTSSSGDVEPITFTSSLRVSSVNIRTSW